MKRSIEQTIAILKTFQMAHGSERAPHDEVIMSLVRAAEHSSYSHRGPAVFVPEPKGFGSTDGWPAKGRPAGGGAQLGRERMAIGRMLDE